MDPKQRSIAKHLHATLASGTFSEPTILALMAMVRQHVPQAAPLAQLAVLALERPARHSLLENYLRAATDAMDGGKASDQPITQFELIGPQHVAAGLDVLFRELELADLDFAIVNSITVVMISLLQSLPTSNASGPVPDLRIGITTAVIALLGQGVDQKHSRFIFPFVVAKNTGIEVPAGTSQWYILDYLVTARCDRKRIALDHSAPPA